MASGGEFDFIRTRLAPLTRGHGSALDLRDDAALLDVPPGVQCVLASDMLVAGVHFPEACEPELAAARVMGSNLSDLAAMGAEPLAYLASMAWPRDVAPDWRARFVDELGRQQDAFGLVLIGGDTTSTPGPFTVSLSLIGTVTHGRALQRSGAVPGDEVWVSGTIGDACLGLDMVRGLMPDAPELRARYAAPRARIGLGLRLRGLASAAIDVSDGLIADAGHLAAASGVALEIDAVSVPLSEPARAWLETSGEGALQRLLTGGDDYELLFTAPAQSGPRIEDLAAEMSLRLSRIGRVQAGQGVVLLAADGRDITPDEGGFTHF